MRLSDIRAIEAQLPMICEKLDIPAGRIVEAWFAPDWYGQEPAIRVDLGTLEDGANLYFQNNQLVKARQLPEGTPVQFRQGLA